MLIRAGALLCLIVGAAALLFFLRKGPAHEVYSKGIPAVKISHQHGKYQLQKEDKPFSIKGGAGYTFMKELSLGGGNTAFCWDTAEISIALEQAQQYNISIIIGLDLPGDLSVATYKAGKQNDELYAAYQRIILRYKNHPALLAWCLGNELSFPFSVRYDPFYATYNSLLEMIHKTDPNHPICTTVINIQAKRLFNIRWRIPALDFVGINIYNSLRTMQRDLDDISLLWNGPYFISEWAPQGGWETPLTSWHAPFEKNSTQKAQDYYDFYTRYMPVNDPRFLGSLAFYWGCRHEYTHTFYSVFSEDSIPTEISEALSDGWKGLHPKHKSPLINDMLVDNSAANRDNILLNAGSFHTASIGLKMTGNHDSLRYSWQVVKDSWTSWRKTWVRFQKPLPEAGLMADSAQPAIIFTAPRKEGPYRLFVTVYNADGYCATANAPFYVIE